MATQQLQKGDDYHRKALRRVPVALLRRVYLHEEGEGRFCGTGGERAKVQIKSVA